MCAWSTPALCQEGETKCLFSWISPGFFLTPLNIVLYCVSHKCRSSRVRRATVWCFRSGGALCWERNNKKKKLHRHSACVWSPCLSGSLKGKVQTKKEKLGHYLLTNLGEVSYTSRHVSWASRPQQRCSVLLNDRSGWGLVLKRKKCSFSVSIEVSRSPAPSHIDLKNHVAGTLFSKQKSLLSLLSWKRRGWTWMKEFDCMTKGLSYFYYTITQSWQPKDLTRTISLPYLPAAWRHLCF